MATESSAYTKLSSAIFNVLRNFVDIEFELHNLGQMDKTSIQPYILKTSIQIGIETFNFHRKCKIFLYSVMVLHKEENCTNSFDRNAFALSTL